LLRFKLKKSSAKEATKYQKVASSEMTVMGGIESDTRLDVDDVDSLRA
jgi:hypothetical protein